MSSGPPSRRNAAQDLARAAQRAAREAEREAQREAEVAAFDKACSDAAAWAAHDHAEASAARDDQAAVKTAQAREDYKSQAREDYNLVKAMFYFNNLLRSEINISASSPDRWRCERVLAAES